MSIYDRLKKDHRTQEDLAAKIDQTKGESAKRKNLFKEFAKEVEAHAAAEEQTFYAALIAEPKGQPKARHSVSEHKEAADLLDELKEMSLSSGGWIQKFRKLKDELEHHVEEEEKEIFKRAKKVLSAKQATTLSRQFEKRKKQELKNAEA